MFKEYLKRMLGLDNIQIQKVNDIIMPLYLKNYEYNIVSLFNQRYVFVIPKEKVNLKSYKVQKNVIEKLFNCQAVLVMEKFGVMQRQNLIKNRIMFIEVGKLLFMPTVGIVLNNRNEQDFKQVDKFTPQIQLCALFFLYNRKGKYTVKQIAETTKLNTMAISRGMMVLENLKLILSENDGRTKHYSLSVNAVDYLLKIQEYAISPIFKTVFVPKIKKIDNIVKSGYSALAVYSELSDNKYETYAISKETYKLIEKSVQIESEDLINEQDYTKLEIWKYDPTLFGDSGIVDKFSLFMSFDEAKDERTEATLNKIKESIING